MRTLRESSLSSLKTGSRTALAALLLVPYLPPAMASVQLTFSKAAKIVDPAGRMLSENGVASHDGTYAYDDAGRLTNVADAVTGSGLGGSYVWNADGTLASMPANGYRRVMGYDEEGRLTGISKLQNGATTALFQYGYGFDGNRRWRKDLAGGVQDWYPCGVACCAGELVTLRSTNGGSTWTTLERKLAKGSASFVDGSELLAPTASGTRRMQGTTETATTDAFGVVRAGSYGMKLSSVYEPLRGDAGLEQAQKQVFVQLQKPVKKPVQRPNNGYTKAGCDRDWGSWVGSCQSIFNGCVAAAIGVPTGVVAACAVACAATAIGWGAPACLLCLGVGVFAYSAIALCFSNRNNCQDSALTWRNRCYAGAIDAVAR